MEAVNQLGAYVYGHFELLSSGPMYNFLQRDQNDWWTYKNIEPPVRIELTTPGLRDQCSIHWAMEATVARYVESVGVILAKNVHKAMMNWAKPLVSLLTTELIR